MSASLLIAAVLGFLVHGGGLGELKDCHLEALARNWWKSINDLRRLNLCRWPSHVENFIAADSAAQRYGDLSQVPGFYFDREAELWRMDLDSRFFLSGFLMPVTNIRRGYFEAMVCFRHPRDQHPFRLRTRRERFQEVA